MKKVVICLNTSWNIYNFRLNLARSIKENGYKVILVAPYDKYSDILAKEFEYHSIYMNNKGTNPKEDFRTIVDLYKLYKIVQPDIVLNYTIKPNIYGNIVCKLLGIKVINNISGLGTVFIKQTFITKFVKLLYKYALSCSSKVFFQNSDDKQLFIEECLVADYKCDLLPGSGVDINRFYPLKNTNISSSFIFLQISRILLDKGIIEYVEAAELILKKYKNVEFHILGSLESINSTVISKKQLAEWEKRGIITYLGESDKVEQFIAKADCIVLASYREGTPRALLEAASMEKPIIATNVPGCREVVEDGSNGYLCEVKNSKDLALKMEKVLLQSNEKRDYMGRVGREKIKKEFDEQIVIKKYLSSLT